MLLAEGVTASDLYLQSSAPSGDTLLWRGVNVLTDEVFFTEAFGSLDFTPESFAPDLTIVRSFTTYADHLYLMGSRPLDESTQIWRVERRSLDTGELDPLFGVDGALEGHPGESISYAIADDESLFLVRPTTINDESGVIIERRMLPAGNL